MKFRNLKLILASTAISLVFVACGSDDTPDTKTGTFTAGAPVKGLSYSTATKSGTTNDAGQFKYIAGETVTFKIGGKLNIGSATGASKISLYNINKLENFQENKTNEISAVKNSSSFFKIFDTQNGNISIVSINSTELANINDTALQDINFSDATNLTAVIAKALDVTTDTANNNYTKRKADSNYNATNSYSSLESNFVNYIYGANSTYNSVQLSSNTTCTDFTVLSINITGSTDVVNRNVTLTLGNSTNSSKVIANLYNANTTVGESPLYFVGDKISAATIYGNNGQNTTAGANSAVDYGLSTNILISESNGVVSGNLTDINGTNPNKCVYTLSGTRSSKN